MSVPNRFATRTHQHTDCHANQAMTQNAIPWAKSLPSHWKTSRIKYLARSEYRAFTDGDWIETPYITQDGVRLIQCGNIGTGEYIEQGFKFISQESMQSLKCTEVRPQDVLICRMRSSPRIRAGRACVAPDLGCSMITAVDNCILRPRTDVDPRFIVYQLSTAGFLDYVEGIARGGTRDRISRRMLGDFCLALPPFGEQQLIAAFLDRETLKIDELIAKKIRLSDLLDERLQSLICRAVTSGLIVSAETRRSQIPWLPSYPAHWRLVALSWFSRVSNGSTPPQGNPVYWQDGDVPWVSSGEVNQFRITTPTALVTQAALRECPIRIIPKGAVLIGMVGQGRTRGMTSILDIDACINQNVAAIEPCIELDPQFLQFALMQAYEPIRQYGRGGRQEALNCRLVGAIRIALPPLCEQLQIASYIKAQRDRSLCLKEQLQQHNLRLQEYRSALISAAVTGQIDVRHYQSEAPCQ
jgi:type I restriction enzyme S subunit